MRRILLLFLMVSLAPTTFSFGQNWYDQSFFMLHEDHHTWEDDEVGRDADPERIARLVGLCRPDTIQIHAKGGPGWTTFPSKIGHTPPRLARDVLAIWRDVAKQDNYHFSVYFNLGNDAEIKKRHPQFMRVGLDGQPLSNSMCLQSGAAEEYLWPMLQEILANYRPQGFWFDGTTHSVRPCFCQACRNRFASDKRLLPPKDNTDPNWADYHEMQREIFREFVERTITEVHRSDPKCLVAFNNAYSLRMPESPPEGLGYLTTDIANNVGLLSRFAHWYDSSGVPFELMTEVFTADPQMPNGQTAAETIPKPAGQIEQEMAVVVANGGRYSAWDIPTQTSGLIPERFELLANVVRPFLRSRQPWCLGTRLPDVSLLHSAAAHYAINNRRPLSFISSDNRIDGAAVALPRLHLNYEMISDKRLADQDIRSPLLIVEHPEKITEEAASGILAFLQNGGRVLWSGKGLSLKMQEAFGIEIVGNSGGPAQLILSGNTDAIDFSRGFYLIRTRQAETRLELEAADGTRRPFLTSCRVGRGQAFYSAMPLFTRHLKYGVPSELLERVFDTVLRPGERRVTTDAPDDVEIVLREKEDQQILHLVNLARGKREVTPWRVHRLNKITDIPPARPCLASIRLSAKPSAVHLQPQGQELHDWSYENGRLRVSIPQFAIHQIVVVERSP